MGTGRSRLFGELSQDFLSRLTLESTDRSPEGVVLREAPLTEDAYVLCFKSLVCLDVIGIEVLDATEQGVEAFCALK